MNIDILSSKHGVRFISLANNTGLEIVLCNYGASIYSLKMDLEEMNVTPKDFNVFYTSGKYYGMTVGRVAGRLRNGTYKVGDKEYHVDQNEGSNCLHGGSKGLSYRKWSYEIKTAKEYFIVRFYLTTPKGDCGFNGKAKYSVTYKVYADDNIFEITYDASCKEDTIFALTNHTYFNLGHAKDILNHTLRIKANEVSVQGEEDFVIEGRIPVAGTPFDFREGKLIKKDINDKELHKNKWLNGYDHRFYFAPVDGLESNVSLSGEYYSLSIYTDFDAIQIYTCGFTNHDQLLNDDYDDVFRAIALECQNFTPEFVKKGDTYHHSIKYVFRRKSDE